MTLDVRSTLETKYTNLYPYTRSLVNFKGVVYTYTRSLVNFTDQYKYLPLIKIFFSCENKDINENYKD